MHCALVKKLAVYTELTDEEVAVLEKSSSHPQSVEARADIICEGDTPSDVPTCSVNCTCA